MIQTQHSFVFRMRRLTHVELRKVITTRSSRWVLISIATLWLLAGGLQLWEASAGEAETIRPASALAGMYLTMGLFAPILSILVMSSDWRSRDVMTLFALEPRRHFVFGAKVLASMILALVLFSAVLMLSLIMSWGVAAVTGIPLEWAEYATGIHLLTVSTIFGTLYGIGIGSALLIPALAIVVSLVQITVDASLSLTLDWGSYFASTSVMSPFVGEGHVGPAVTSFVLWYVIPIAVGLWRNQSKEAA